MLSYLTLQPSRYLFNCFPAKSKQNIASVRGELNDLPNESIATAESSLSRTEVLSRCKHPSVVCANETHHAVWQQPHLQPYACSLFLTSRRPWPPLDSSLNIPLPCPQISLQVFLLWVFVPQFHGHLMSASLRLPLTVPLPKEAFPDTSSKESSSPHIVSAFSFLLFSFLPSPSRNTNSMRQESFFLSDIIRPSTEQFNDLVNKGI